MKHKSKEAGAHKVKENFKNTVASENNYLQLEKD